MRFQWSLAIVLFSVVLSAVADAQVLTGSISGTVQDESGGVLPGAIARASSPSLIGGPMVVKADDRGVFRLAALAPGEYTLEIELANFSGYSENSIQVNVQSSIERSVTLKIAGIAE
jgi:hypothetical protein